MALFDYLDRVFVSCMGRRFEKKKDVARQRYSRHDLEKGIYSYVINEL